MLPLTAATAAMQLATPPSHRTLADRLYDARLAAKEIPVFRADGTRRGMADRQDMRNRPFLLTIAQAIWRSDGAVRKLFLKALPGEISRPVAEDNQTCVRDGRGFRHHPDRCMAYAEDGQTALDGASQAVWAG